MDRRFYSPENVRIAAKAQIGVTAAAVIICGYLAITSLLRTQDIWRAERMLRAFKRESASLSREAARRRKAESSHASARTGGVDAFAVQFARWADARNVRVESVVPEGRPAPTEIQVGGTKLGVWTVSRVRVQGRGPFRDLMGLLDEFCRPQMQVQMESFALQSVSVSRDDAIGFNLVFTVYEKKGESS